MDISKLEKSLIQHLYYGFVPIPNERVLVLFLNYDGIDKGLVCSVVSGLCGSRFFDAIYPALTEFPYRPFLIDFDRNALLERLRNFFSKDGNYETSRIVRLEKLAKKILKSRKRGSKKIAFIYGVEPCDLNNDILANAYVIDLESLLKSKEFS